ncbi:MAG: hypothetical protein Q9162_005017 [Coniocarpon cinnabarinum]
MNNIQSRGQNVEKTCLQLLKGLSSSYVEHLLNTEREATRQALAQSLFKCAVRTGEAQVLKKLIEVRSAGIDVNKLHCEHNGHACTPLELSAYLQHTSNVKVLLQNGANVHRTCSDAGMPNGGALTSMIQGISQERPSSMDMASLLLEAGARCPEYFTLHVAKIHEVQLANSLVRASTGWNYRWTSKPDFLAEAIQYFPEDDFLEIIDLLAPIEFYPLKNLSPLQNLSPVDMAVKRHSVRAVQKFWQQGCVLNKKNLIENAVGSGCADMVRCLCSHHAPVSDRAMELALENSNVEIVRILLPRADVRNGAFLALAFRNECAEMAHLLIETGAPIDGVGFTQLKMSDLSLSYDRPMTLFSEAIRARNRNCADFCIGHGALENITERSRFEASLLAAIEVGNLTFTKWLLQNGVSAGKTRIKGDYGRKTRTNSDSFGVAHQVLSKALAFSINEGQNQICHYLLDAGATPTDEALKLAVEGRHYNLVRAMLNTMDLEETLRWNEPLLRAVFELVGCSIFKKMSSPATLMHRVCGFALSEQQWHLANSVLNFLSTLHNPRIYYYPLDYDDDDFDGCSLLDHACKHGQISLSRRLVDLDTIAVCDITLLRAMLAGEESFRMVLSFYLQHYPQGKQNFGCLAMYKAIVDENGPLLRRLLASKMDRNGSYMPCASEHRLKDSDELVPHLQALGGRTPLGVAIKSNSLMAVGILLEHGAQHTCNQDRDCDALKAAIQVRSPSIVNMLVANGADVNLPAQGFWDHTPLQQAIKIGDYDMAEQLLNHGAHVNEKARRKSGSTPLQFASTTGFLGIIWLLLERGAEVNAEPAQINGRTALEGAAEHGRIDTVQLLLNVGADIEGPRGMRNGLAIPLADENGHLAVVELLRAHLPWDPLMESMADSHDLDPRDPTFVAEAKNALFPLEEPVEQGFGVAFDETLLDNGILGGFDGMMMDFAPEQPM